jgi:hypothetical protein
VVGAWSSITIGENGTPVISYYDLDNSAVKVVKCIDTACHLWRTPVTLDSAVVGSPSIAIGIDANPVISYTVIPDPLRPFTAVKLVHCTDQACLGHSVPITLNPATGTDTINSSLAVSADGNPYVSYITNGVLQVTRCTNITCTTAKAPLIADSSGTVGGSQAIVIGADANPVLAYIDDLAGDVNVAKLTHSSWTPYGWGR